MTLRCWEVSATDGCIWTVCWLRDAAAWNVSDDGDDIRELRECTCNVTDRDGVYDALETIEAAISTPIPADLRTQMHEHAAARPPSTEAKRDWGRTFSFEVRRLSLEGSIVASWAPGWTDEPDSPRWDPSEFPLPVGPDGRAAGVRREGSGVFADQSIFCLASNFVRADLAEVDASGRLDSEIREKWKRLTETFGPATPFHVHPELLSAGHAVAWITDSVHGVRTDPGPAGLAVAAEDWETARKDAFGDGTFDARGSAELRRLSAIVRGTGRWRDHHTLLRRLVPGDALAIRWWYLRAVDAALRHHVFQAGYLPWARVHDVHNHLYTQAALSTAVPFFVPSGHIESAADGEPLDPADHDDIRLPFRSVLIVPAEAMHIPPHRTMSCELADVYAALEGVHPWLRGPLTPYADSIDFQAFARRDLPRLGYLFQDFRAGAHITIDDAIATRGALVDGLVLIADAECRLADEFVWCLAIPDERGGRALARVAVAGRRSATAWATQIDNLAALAAWADWHPPEMVFELPDDPESPEFRRALNSGRFRRLERRGAAGNVHVLDVSSSLTRHHAGVPTGRIVPPHRRRGHWRKVRTGTRADWDNHRSVRRVRISPTIVNAGLGAPDPAIYRLPRYFSVEPEGAAGGAGRQDVDPHSTGR